MKKTVIVCGMPRSGTRSVANILNASEEVLITAEFPSGVTNKLFSLVNAMGNFFDKRAYKDKDAWELKKAQLVHDVWLANSVFDGDLNKYNYIGNKTPSNELFFSQYESVFSSEKPYYVYCFRSPLKVISSLENMPWNKETPMENWERWKESFKIYQRMVRKAPGRVLLVSFDLRLNVSQGLPPKFLVTDPAFAGILLFDFEWRLCAATRALFYLRLSDLSRKTTGWRISPRSWHQRGCSHRKRRRYRSRTRSG